MRTHIPFGCRAGNPPARSLLPLLLVLLAVSLLSWGCSPSPADPEAKSDGDGPPSAEKSPAEPAAPTEAGEPKADGTATESPQASPKSIPDSIKELQAKIQPPNTQAEDLSALVKTSEATIKSFVEAILAGDREEAYKLLLADKEYEEIVSEGLKSILGLGLVQQNKEVIDQLIESLKGQKLEKLEWKPGAAAYSRPPKTFRKRLPLISTSKLHLTVAGGVLIQLNVEQMVYHENTWKVFRVTIP